MKISDNRELKWCEGHDEPVIVYEDGSWSCRWQLIVEAVNEDECKVVPFLPKEVLDLEEHTDHHEECGRFRNINGHIHWECSCGLAEAREALGFK